MIALPWLLMLLLLHVLSLLLSVFLYEMQQLKVYMKKKTDFTDLVDEGHNC